MRFILPAILLFAIVAPVHTQGNDIPFYIECGAEEYMVETYYLFSPTSDLVFELAIAETEEDQNIALANLYITLVEIRDELLDIDDVPECAKTYHDLMLSATNTAADMYALEVFANTTGDDYYAGLSKQRLATLEEISESIELERLELGWTNEDGDLVNEPPTLEGD